MGGVGGGGGEAGGSELYRLGTGYTAETMFPSAAPEVDLSHDTRDEVLVDGTIAASASGKAVRLLLPGSV
jgi:hypothetical protein